MGQIYLFASEVVALRRRVNDYTEALLSKAWEKEEQFQREFNQAGSRMDLLLGCRKTTTRLWGHLSLPWCSERMKKTRRRKEEEDDDCATASGDLPSAGGCAKSEENGTKGNVKVSGASSIACSTKFMDDDKADEILRQLQADAPLKKLSPVYD